MNYFTNGNIYLVGGFCVDNPIFAVGFFFLAAVCYIYSFIIEDYK